MGQLIDNLIAFRILYLLVKPFEKSDAYRLGIIDKNGKLLRKAEELKTSEEKDAYNYLTRLIFNLKRLLAKLPGGSSMLASFVAAYFLIKEGVEHDDLSNLEERFFALNTQINEGLVLVEEQLLVEKFLILMEDELNFDAAIQDESNIIIDQKTRELMDKSFNDFKIQADDVEIIKEDGEAAPANSIGSGQMAQSPLPIGAVKRRNNWKIQPKAFGAVAFEVSGKAYNGFRNAKVKGAKWDDHLVPSDEDKESYDKIRQYSKTYNKKPILIKHRDQDAYQYIKH